MASLGLLKSEMSYNEEQRTYYTYVHVLPFED